jgi:hypothetical protein
VENQGRRVKALFVVFLLCFTTNLFAAVSPREARWSDRFFSRIRSAISQFVTAYGDVLSVPDGKK